MVRKNNVAHENRAFGLCRTPCPSGRGSSKYEKYRIVFICTFNIHIFSNTPKHTPKIRHIPLHLLFVQFLKTPAYRTKPRYRQAARRLSVLSASQASGNGPPVCPSTMLTLKLGGFRAPGEASRTYALSQSHLHYSASFDVSIDDSRQNP
jgi:hypothetical protein